MNRIIQRRNTLQKRKMDKTFEIKWRKEKNNMTHNDARRSMKISMFSLLLILFCISTLSIVTYAKDGEILTDPNPPTISDPIKVQYGTDWYKEFWVNETDANSFVKRIEVKPTENVGNVEYKSGSSWSSFSKDADLQGPNWSSGSKGYVKEWLLPTPMLNLMCFFRSAYFTLTLTALV